MNLFTRLRQFFSPRRDAFMGPADREWRQLIPQDVRRMPGDELGRKRAARSRLPLVLAVIFFATLGGIVWVSIDETTAVVAGNGALRYKTDGFYPVPDLQRLVAQGKDGAAKDVAAIKADLEMDTQIASADVRRRGDGSLEIILRERKAVAKIASLPGSGPMVVRLVSPEGVQFSGAGYPSEAIRNLPEIIDYRTSGSGDKATIEGIEVAGPFLLAAQSAYPNLYREWSALSLRDCFGAQEDSPGSNLRVAVRRASQPADRPVLTEIVFSTANWRNELAILSRLDLDGLLRRPGITAPAYVLKLSIQNRTSARPVPEPRLVPATTR
ncbi:MAG: hypothetical protein RLZ70_452 [Verrucomicrobiota bacterium]|jgi:hypothetical protein